ncbi:MULTISPECIES: alpha-pore-forming tripartite toxin MakABE regulator [unclassified Bradyrhizobium]|uniref:alpha-pore-forming tripartite toxin MakABE regulator n=1 Tax=unclassified Bradyrhizobium TaxID=2631580 RepID=UPI0018DE29EE|nr:MULTISPECIES: hypothetical protein [unclassified Bradyrhizobium]
MSADKTERAAAALSQVDVLIVADVEGALASGNLQDNVYMIDTNKHAGSGIEGQAELYTAVKDGQVLNWSVVGVSPSSDVNITQFTGQMINDKICVPQSVTTPDGTYWSGRVEAQGFKGNQQYSCVLTMDGKAMTFDPFLKIS